MNEYDVKKAPAQRSEKMNNASAPQSINGIPNSVLTDVFAGKRKATSQMMGYREDLAPSIAAKMNQAFGADFTRVQVYRSDAMAGTGMHGMAQGDKVVLSSDVDLNTMEGQAVLGHELSHIRAQSMGIGGSSRGLLNNASLEHQADTEGMLAARGMSISGESMGMSMGLGMQGVEGLTPIGAGLGANAAAPMQADKHDKDMRFENEYWLDKDVENNDKTTQVWTDFQEKIDYDTVMNAKQDIGNSGPESRGGYNKTFQQLMMFEATNLWTRLDQKEKKCLYDYSGEGYIGINNYKRGLTGEMSKEDIASAKQKSKYVESAIGKYETPRSFTTYRFMPGDSLKYMRSDNGEQANEGQDKSYQGSILTDKSFMSSTTNRSQNFGGNRGYNVVLKINVPKGARVGAPLSLYSKHDEEEFLMKPNTKLRVVNENDLGENNIYRKEPITELVCEIVSDSEEGVKRGAKA